jgi:hypothetical protein
MGRYVQALKLPQWLGSLWDGSLRFLQRLINFPAVCWLTTTPRFQIMATLRRSKQETTQQLMFSSAELLARTSQSQDSEQEWMESVVNSQQNSLNLLAGCGPNGWFGRTSPASCRLTEDGRLEPFWESWGNSGMGSHTEFLTLSSAEYHSAAVASSLSDVLETGAVPQRYFLSATACRGILRRAEKRGKALPMTLRRALEQVAEDSSAPATHEEMTP